MILLVLVHRPLLLLYNLKEMLGAMSEKRNIVVLIDCQSVLDVASGRAELDRYRLITEMRELKSAIRAKRGLHMAWLPSHDKVPTGKKEKWVENSPY